MADVPATQYARTPDGVHIGYQVSGDGPIDLLFTAGFVFPAESCWEDPSFRRFLERLRSFSRLIMFDRRGTGVSDPVPPSDPPTLEQWVEDALTVLDAVESERAAVFAWANPGGATGALLAATHPERVSSLVLANTTPKGISSPDFPFGQTDMLLRERLKNIEAGWGTVEGLPEWLQAVLTTEELEWTARAYRRGASPAVAAAIVRVGAEVDIREALPAIAVPTLVIHQDWPLRDVEVSRYLADHIPGAKLLQLPGTGYPYVYQGDNAELLDGVEEFLTGARRQPEPERVLATVLFSDIVESTERAAELGDKRWRSVLEQHDDLTRRQIDRYRGKWIKTTGDGVLATFDGPARAVQCAQSIRDGVGRALGLEMRCGLHTGEIELRRDDIAGIAVHIAQRVSALAGPGEILVSRTVTDLVAGSGIAFADRGTHELKGVNAGWQLFAVG